MEDIEIIVSALGVKKQDNNKEFVERCSNLKLFDFIKNCITSSLRLMNQADYIKTIGINTYVYTKLLRLNSEVSGNIFDCEICGQSCPDGSKLKRHMLVHSQVREFGCEICGKQFTLSQNLRTHMRIHEGCKPYQCPTCDFSSTQLSNLKVHMKAKGHDNDIDMNRFT